MSEAGQRSFCRAPSHAIDFGAGLETCFALLPHVPEQHHLRAVAHEVEGDPGEVEQARAAARLLLHFPNGRFAESLARLELALGEGPIVVFRAMDHR